MQVWIASVIILFALSQLWEWLQGLEYSLPVLVLGGLLLSFVSNYDKRSSIPFWPSVVQPQESAGSARPQYQGLSLGSPSSVPIAEATAAEVSPSVPLSPSSLAGPEQPELG